MLHGEYEKNPNVQTLIFYTLAEYSVFLSFRHGFASMEEKSMLHHQHKYDAKTACQHREGTLEECLAKKSS